MSIILKHNLGFVISHEEYINYIYENTSKGDRTCSFSLKADLFDIVNPYKLENRSLCDNLDIHEGPPKKKRKLKKSTVLGPQVVKVKDVYCNILRIAHSSNLFKCLAPNEDFSNKLALNAAEACTMSTADMKTLGKIAGGNNAPSAVYQSIGSCSILLPPNSRFISGDVKSTVQHLDEESFDLIILDPPWWNKYIRRSKAKRRDWGYEMMYNEEVASLPLGRLMKPGAVVAVWCTNCQAHSTAVQDLMFPKWGVEYQATWFWMKVTKSGHPICPFSEATGKQPFERILLGIHKQLPKQDSIPDGQLILSIPSALHSHKPPLNEVLSPYFSVKEPKCLEVFARYLLPHTTSVGFEPLRWQHSSLFTENSTS